MSFPGSTSPGPSGLQANHLKEVLKLPSSSSTASFLSILTRFINLLVAGKTPPPIIPHLCGATLLAIRKKNGDLRPIAIGEVLHRLISKCLARMSRSAASHILSPLQLGVGVHAGCEAIIHATSSILEDPSIAPNDRWVLQVDFSNAFNSIDRNSMFAQFRSCLPKLSAWMESCYSFQLILHFGNWTILSSYGVQCGDPLGPLGFALTLHPLIELIKSKVSSLHLNVWFLDNGTLCGPPDSWLLH